MPHIRQAGDTRVEFFMDDAEISAELPRDFWQAVFLQTIDNFGHYGIERNVHIFVWLRLPKSSTALQAADTDCTDAFHKEVTELLHQRHRIGGSCEDKFVVCNQREVAATATTVAAGSWQLLCERARSHNFQRCRSKLAVGTGS